MLAHLYDLFDRLGRRLPQPCVLCGDAGGPAGLCDGCRADLPWQPATHCPVCALPSIGAPDRASPNVGASVHALRPFGDSDRALQSISTTVRTLPSTGASVRALPPISASAGTGASITPSVCGRCQRHPPAFDAVTAAFQYGFPMDGMIRRLKFHAALHLAQILGENLAAVVRSAPRPGLLLPVPLGSERLRSRGFNQSGEVARVLSRQLAVPLSLDTCVRVRDTPGQSGLSLAARRGNLKGAFRCDRRLDGIEVAVVDDVMTSGATLDAVAQELKRAGALRVMGWVVARTPSLRAGISA